MDILVCVKRVPSSMEDIELTTDGDISSEYLSFSLNEYDTYSLEEAVQMKEDLGGEVKVVTIGAEETEDILKLTIAKGADSAIRLWDEKLEEIELSTDVKARIVANLVSILEPDLVFTGLSSDDENHTQFGVELAAILDLPYASFVKSLDYGDETIVHRGLEGGLQEKLRIKTPAVLTLPTGINEPRYASLMARRRVDDEKIETMNLADLGFEGFSVPEPKVRIKELCEASMGERAEIFEGDPEEISKEMVKSLDEEGVFS